METPICVIDAKTLVDHIQELKNWIYSGQIHLVLSSSTIEQVEQLYQKSIEPKPTVPETSRPRSLGKPSKKEYPAFDINPRVAREYLERLKSRKEQDVDPKQRMFFQESENHEAVRFQQPNEQYTPWKDLDVDEEKPEVVEGPPTSWAEALRRKQNMANGISEKSLSKAPAKPKLVARAAGSEPSPWKVKKDAPKVTANDVPGALRPLMSCVLWRLHESIERNDPNQLFLLSDQDEIKSVAEKLNILVRSCKDLSTTIASKIEKTGVDAFGDLEREFGVQQKTVAPQDGEEPNGQESALNEVNGDLEDEDTMDKSVSSEVTANTAVSSIVHEKGFERQISEHEETPMINGNHDNDKVEDENGIVDTAATSAAEDSLGKPTKGAESIQSLVDSIIKQDFQKHLRETINCFKTDGVNSLQYSTNQSNAEQHPPPKIPLPQCQNVEAVHHLEVLQTSNDNSLSQNTPTPSTLEMKGSEDSDGEEVVFVPQSKRLSAQHKPVQKNSRPSTPKEQPQQKSAGESPQKSVVKPQSKGKAARHSPNPSSGGRPHSQPVNAPTVIDPDAFGRDFRVNLNPSPRVPYQSNGHSQNRIRGNMQNAQVGQASHSSSRQSTRTSPSRNATQENLQRLTPIPGPAPKDTPNHKRQASRTSPQKAPVPKVEEAAATDLETEAITIGALSKPQITQFQAAEYAEFVPRNSSPARNVLNSSEVPGPTDYVPTVAFPKAGLKPNGSQPRIFEANEFVPRPSRPIREFKPRIPRAKVFEATEFLPRDFVPRTTMPRAHIKRDSPEPESIEPRPSNNDVDYVLKSGSTRASARGRGRLWSPS